MKLILSLLAVLISCSLAFAAKAYGSTKKEAAKRTPKIKRVVFTQKDVSRASKHASLSEDEKRALMAHTLPSPDLDAQLLEAEENSILDIERGL